MLSGLVSSGLTGPTRSRARQAKLTLTGVKNTFAGPDRFALDVVGGIARSNAFELSTNLITGGLVTQNGIEMQSATQMYLNQGGNTAMKISGGVVRMNSTNGMQIGVSGTEVTLVGTANVLDQRSGVNAQTFRLYTTYTSATSYETLNLKGKAAANFEIGPESGSAGGTLRGLTIGGYALGSATITGWLQFRPNATTAALEAFYLGPIADSTAVGGNARGANSVDFQTDRDTAAKVVSGNNSIQAGSGNTTSGTYAATFGHNNTNN